MLSPRSQCLNSGDAGLRIIGGRPKNRRLNLPPPRTLEPELGQAALERRRPQAKPVVPRLDPLLEVAMRRRNNLRVQVDARRTAGPARSARSEHGGRRRNAFEEEEVKRRLACFQLPRPWASSFSCTLRMRTDV